MMSIITKMWITGGILLLFLCIAVVPASAASTRTIIGPGSDVFIGEEGLDLRTAVGSEFAYVGWWASGKNYQTDVADAVTTAEHWDHVSINPSYFSDRSGAWYKVNFLNSKWDGGPLVMTVRDPWLNTAIWDLDNKVDVSGKTVGRTNLTIRVDTNMYSSLNPSRSSASGDTDSYIRIKVKNQDGDVFSNLKDITGHEKSLSNNIVWTQPYYWDGKWYTGLNNGITFEYPSGTYIVWAESNLNGMKDNYKEAGADYVGKTVSASKTFTILNFLGPGDTLPVRADYSVTPEYGTAPITVTFTDISKGVITANYIEFGDGQKANFTTGTLTHTYTQEGVFFPVMHAWNSQNSDTETNGTVSVNVASGLGPGVAKAYNRILRNAAILNNHVSGKVVYTAGLVAPSTSIPAWGGKTAITLPASEGYFFFIDDHPGANFEHPCRYVHVTPDGQTTVFDAWSPPDYLELQQIAGEFEIPDFEFPITPVPTWVPTTSITPVPCVPDASHNYAILVSGGVNKSLNYNNYYTDIQFMYKTLVTDYKYPKDHIYVLLSDGPSNEQDQLVSIGPAPTYTRTYVNSVRDLNGDGTEDVYGAATSANLRTLLNSAPIAGLTSQDNLYIFTTSHGGWDKVINNNNAFLALWGNDYMTDAEFMSLLPKNAKSITVTMGQCFSGGFIDDLTTKYTGSAGTTRVISTASDANSYSSGNDFTYPWIASVAMHTKTGAPLTNADNTPYDNRVSMKEAFVYAQAVDLSRIVDKPQYADVASGIGSSQYLTGCTAAAPILKVTSPNGGESWTTGPTYTVSWSQSSLPQDTKINIELMKGGLNDPAVAVKQQDITTSSVAVGAGGSVSWKVPTTGLPGGAGSDYWVKISTTGSAYKLSDGSDNYFSIAAVTAKPGNISVTTTPVTGATIYIDNIERGLSNKLVTGLTATTHFVRVAIPGYTCGEGTVRVWPGITTNAKLLCMATGTNDAPFGSIAVTSTVPESEVYIDGVPTGYLTPAKVYRLEGSYRVSVKAEGYPLTEEKQVTVVKDQEVLVSIDPTGFPNPIPEFPAEILPVALIAAVIAILFFCIRPRE